MDEPWSAPTARIPDEPWTTEGVLHVALAGVVIIGWTLVYMTLMGGIDRPDAAREVPARTAISANLPAR